LFYCFSKKILVYTVFFGFLCLERGLEIFVFLEVRALLLAYLFFKSSTKESFSAFAYLFSFSCFLRLLFLRNLIYDNISIGLYTFFVRISIRVLMFFSKLPSYFLHHWLPKAHVEVVTYGSVTLAALMLKFRVPFVAGLWDELFFRLLVRFFGLFCMLGSTDFKVFVAYSSIIHMTVFCLGLRILSRGIFDYFIVPHTLLSRCIFWFFGGVYAKKGIRLFTFFGGYRPGSLVLLWLGLPMFANFLAEAIIFPYLSYDVRSFLGWFFVFVCYAWVSLKFLSGSTLFKRKDPTALKNFLRCMVLFTLFWTI